MGQSRGPYSNRGPIEATSIPTALTFDPPIVWVQVVSAGSGGLVVKTENGDAQAYTALGAGDVLVGPFTELTSMTLSKIRYGDGQPPSITPVSSLLSSTSTGNGASMIGVADAGTFTAQTTVEASLQELYQHLFSAHGGCVPIPLATFREVNSTGDVGDITANGGVLASDTTPVFDAVATSNEEEILWATGNVDPIGVSFALPADFDDTADAHLDLILSSGTTNAASIVCASAWSAGAAGTEVSDTADDSSLKSATPHVVTVTIDAGDIPAGANRATFRLTPPTHSTNAISLYGARLTYKRKLLTS